MSQIEAVVAAGQLPADSGVQLWMDHSALAAALRASRRRAALVREEMKDGLGGLAIVSSIAPWLGLLGTVLAIPDSFIACGGEKSACMAAMVERLSGSIWPTAMGLFIGLIALWGFRSLSGAVETFSHEMEGAALGLVNQLSRPTQSR